MAKMIPPFVETFKSAGEEQIYNECEKQLSKKYTVIHSWRWIGSKGNRSQGEGDFLIIHPQKGLLVIEVKAGIITLKDGVWTQQNRRTGQVKTLQIDPEEQASETKFKLIEKLKGLDFKILVCTAVWFPSVNFTKKNLPSNYNPAMLFDSKDLDDVENAINNAFQYWSAETGFSSSLSETNANNLLRTIAPTLNLSSTIHADFEHDKRELIRLTKEQVNLLDFLSSNRFAVISGGAGTGKTVIASEKAMRLAQIGRKVLFLCFNKLLSEVIRESLGQFNIEVRTFDSLCSKFGGRSGDFDARREYFFEYITSGENQFNYDDIIIDEGQDFGSLWLEALYDKVKSKGCFYIFYDKNQMIFQFTLPDFIKNSDKVFELTKNCRNTASIAGVAYNTLGIKFSSEELMNKSRLSKPLLYPVRSKRDFSYWLQNEINVFLNETGLGRESVVILTDHDTKESLFNSFSSITNIPFSYKRESDKLFVSTMKKYKGLEADLVIILDVLWNRLGEAQYKSLLYTSFSRARYRLIVSSPPLEHLNTLLNFNSIKLTDNQSFASIEQYIDYLGMDIYGKR